MLISVIRTAAEETKVLIKATMDREVHDTSSTKVTLSDHRGRIPSLLQLCR